MMIKSGSVSCIGRIVLLILIISASACVATSSQIRPFDEYKERAPAVDEIDVLLDLTILYDLRGEAIGIDLEDHKQTLKEMEFELSDGLKARGYKPNFLYRGMGLTHQLNDEQKYMLAVDGKSTGESFSGFSDDVERERWASPDMRDFLEKLIQVSVEPIHNDAEESPTTETDGSDTVNFPPETIPVEIVEGPNRYFAYLRADIGEVGVGKTVGSTLLTGLLSAVITGGMMVYTEGPISNTAMNFVLLDKDQGDVIWHSVGQGGSSEIVRAAVVNTLATFVGTDGETYTAPEPIFERKPAPQKREKANE